MATAKEVFKALPHVTEVWITKDGNHHLHGDNGGEKFVRPDEGTDNDAEKDIEVNYEKLTKDLLKDELIKRDIDFDNNASKPDLIKLLTDNDAEQGK